MAVAAVLGLLGRHIAQDNLDANGLNSYLSSQRDTILGALPAGLGQGLAQLAPGAPTPTAAPAPAAPSPNQASPLPMQASETATRSVPTAAPSPVAVTADRPVVRAALPRPAVHPAVPALALARHWPWLLALALAVGVVGYFALGRRSQVVATESVTTPAVPARLGAPIARVTAPTGRYEAATGTYRYEVGTDTTLQLPTGISLTVGSHSAEAQLWQLLTAKSQALAIAKSLSGIPLDRIYFDPGKATLMAASRAQLANLAALLTAFPHATLKFGGFTDDQGPAEANLLLSADRANAVRNALVAKGLAPSRVAAQGYGQTHPVVPNATPAGQAQNRRVAMLLTSK